jgi:hypothetical protein
MKKEQGIKNSKGKGMKANGRWRQQVKMGRKRVLR